MVISCHWHAIIAGMSLIIVCVSYTVNSRLADTSLLRAPRYYRQQRNPRRKLQMFDWNKLPLLQTLATTDLRTLCSVPRSQFYCFLSRYSRHRAHPLLLSSNQNSFIFFSKGPLCSHPAMNKLVQSVMIQMVDRPNTTPTGQGKKTLTLKALL